MRLLLSKGAKAKVSRRRASLVLDVDIEVEAVAGARSVAYKAMMD